MSLSEVCATLHSKLCVYQFLQLREGFGYPSRPLYHSECSLKAGPWGSVISANILERDVCTDLRCVEMWVWSRVGMRGRWEGRRGHEGLMKGVFVFCCFGFRALSEPKEWVGR